MSSVDYYPDEGSIRVPSRGRAILSRICFPLLTLLSRERSLQLGLVPIDDERVIEALKQVEGRVLDVGCGSNLFVRSYGNGVGVDVMHWTGVDVVIDDAGTLPFEDASFDTVSFLACLNHIPNREEAMAEAHRVLRPGGKVLVTMITPRLGAFIHLLRTRNDPDLSRRDVVREGELLGMSAGHVRNVIRGAGFGPVARKRFVYGLNSIFSARKPTSG